MFEQIDQCRRWQGRMFDALGWGPIQTPFRVIFNETGVTLRAYGSDHQTKPVLVMIPAPIKRPYIWDLDPKASLVRLCLDNGVRVYLTQWEELQADGEGFGLADYADRLILDCLNAVEAEAGQRSVFLAGHSLGGTLAAIFSALHPERIQGLILLGAPLHFGPDVGDLDVFVAAGPPARLITSMLGQVPGSYLSAVSVVASPKTFVWSRWLDWAQSFPDQQARATHLRVERWILDEFMLAGRLFEDVVELLYREDRLMRGNLTIAGRRAAPELVTAPLLGVLDAQCHVVPPQSILPFLQAATSVEKRLLWYEGDIGVGLRHLGMLIGQGAHRMLWPKVLSWIHARWKTAGLNEPVA
jgi:polyhydroxyalkanoate synthase subunit PhaC